ncbi:MAG: acetyl-CoA carboxylase carboxyltransferase subunit alpha [Chitinispirillaceae bacterium]|jgi:acetyl-CoA carboxylase carboxyl transferase subunit alpha|nr:acetyl-CoA carboxylase carboxyltransferase subunit alpha [Chitinispirillaceae bacterium]
MELEFEKPVVAIQKELDKARHKDNHGKRGYKEQIDVLEKQLAETLKKVYANLSPWQTVQVARHPLRPILRDYIDLIFTDFVELHGDRCFGDDRAMIGGFARLGNQKVMLIGHNKGKNVDENIRRNFGMASPEGYRKALRLMRLAEKYNLPVVTFIDTAGAFPGLSGEERGQHEAIARNLTEMARLTVPIIVVVTGEGGSGGALGIGVGDALLMLSNSTYSVISPEGCAGILWRDGTFAPQAAEAMKVTAKQLLELGVIDEIIPEPLGGAHRDQKATAESVRYVLLKYIKEFSSYSSAKLCAKRFEKFSAMGKFTE